MPSNVQEVFVDAFNEAHPGITLEIIGQESINETLRVAIQGGAAPVILLFLALQRRFIEGLTQGGLKA